MLVFRRSFADYTWRLLQRAARPYGLCVTHPLACPDPLFTPLLQPA
jgi:sarcosine oxidase subunit gamma